MQTHKPFFIDNDCFRQLTEIDSNNYVVYHWKQLPKFYFYSFYFKHSSDVIYIAKTSAVKFRIDDREVILQRDANLLIPANSKYSFRGLEHIHSEMYAFGPVALRDSWETVSGAMTLSQNLTRVS